jgi:hypothetical protein
MANTAEKGKKMKEYLEDLKFWACAALGAFYIYAFCWLFSVACMALGGAPEVCGL